MRYSFVFDQNRCTGCHACRLACTIENGLALDQSWRSIHTFNPRHEPAAPVFHLSLACNHCAEPACLTACPAQAYEKDGMTGAVLVDDAKCIGCRYCTWACPYDAPCFDAASGVITKCTFCVERIREGGQPACAALCPTGALKFERLTEEEITNDAAGFPQTEFEPAIRIIPWREGGAPVGFGAASGASVPPPAQATASRITLRSEWSLALFTFLVSILFGLVMAASMGDRTVSPVLFLGIAVAGLGLSTLHLGKPLRAWRATLGVRTSWLSREIVGVGAFGACGAAYLAWLPQQDAVGWLATAVGLFALVSIDMVYGVTERPGITVPHSGNALLTGLYLAGVLSVSPALVGLVGFVKLALYTRRKLQLMRAGLPARPVGSVVRVLLGFGVPAATWIAAGDIPGWAMVAVLLGELVDRGEYYSELEIRSPQRQLAHALAAWPEPHDGPGSAAAA
jgi:Fe-S-cluster-containing dehydrogenase component/DMSO reductase anchor subunit